MKKPISIDFILELIKNTPYLFLGNSKNKFIDNASLPLLANSKSICWTSLVGIELGNIVLKSTAGLIIAQEKVRLTNPENCIIVVANPKLIFSKIVNSLFVNSFTPSISNNVSIHPSAKIDKSAYIGPNTTIGNCEIGPGVVIHGNCFIYDNVKIEANVKIHAGCVIGTRGSGYVKDKNNNWIPFPQIGATIIEEDVEIGANSYIARGALLETRIKKGVKIGLACSIGHNVIVGENSIVLANSLIAGSAKIGKDVYIAPKVVIKNKKKIGDRATVGMASVVHNDVPEDTTVVGNPAESIESFRAKRKAIKELLK